MLERWGFELRERTYLSWRDVQNINIEKYIKRLNADKKAKKVFTVKDSDILWTEKYLTDWFKQNYSLFGITEIHEPFTPEYKKYKQKIGFYGYPDFLGKQNDKIIRIELECFPCGYHHTPDYCEMVLCYELNGPTNSNQKWYGLKELLGYDEIIRFDEILDYFALKYPDFKEVIQEKLTKELSERTW